MNYSTVEKHWIHEDLHCVVLMNGNSGCRCGYVGVPETHPIYGVGYS